MNLTKIFTTAAFTAAAALIQTGESAAATQCVPLHDGVEYRAYLPDGKRFIYIDLKVLAGLYPSVFVIADKNYDAAPVKLADSDPLNRWWIDRSRPFAFSTDKVRIRWMDSHTFDFVTDLFSKTDPAEIAQPFRGLEKQGDHYVSTGASDINTFAFQTRLEMTGFNADYFEIAVPAVTYDGTTLTVPVVRFERDERTFTAKC